MSPLPLDWTTAVQAAVVLLCLYLLAAPEPRRPSRDRYDDKDE